MSHKLRTQIIAFFYKIQTNPLILIVRKGLTMLMPSLVIGAVSYAILYFPNTAFHIFITEQWPGIGNFLNVIYQGTFGMFSMILVVTLSISYVLEKNETVDKIPCYVITAIASFGTHILMSNEAERLCMIGTQGCFIAMIVGLLSCYLLSKLRKIEILSLRKYTFGMEAIPANAIQSILPSAITIGCFALCQNIFLTLSKGKSIFTLWSELSCHVFENMGNGFSSALLYTALVHILWAFGFHGSHMMETVAANCFSNVGQDIIFSKSFFDTFVVMGGCGTTLCALIGIFLFVRKKRMRNIGKVALPTILFNSNDIFTFGIPIILNPALIIPFIFVPVLALFLSYGAVATGLVPYVTREISWTMPAIFNGYIATGSIRGSILQIIIIGCGVAIYTPFLKMEEKLYDIRMQEKIQKLVRELQEYEERGESPNFLHRLDDSGMVARMLLQELQYDIQQKKLYLVYQPQADRDGKYIGAEALLRWNHSEYGFIYPPLIIHLAKEGKILPDLERLLFDMAINAIHQVSLNCKEPFKISVNITAHSLEWNIEEYINEKLKEYQVPPEKLWLEITEQDVLTNSEMAANKISRLKDAGYTLLIDDFGMGHTSLNYLQSDSFSVVKLDGSLVRHILERETNQKIVASIIELSKKLNIKVIAEYVETEEQRQFLKDIGCDFYQGYLIGKPVVLEQFIENMAENRTY